MKRIIIICEGETEREFCKNVLTPHLIPFNIYIQTPLIKRSMGGIVGWHFLKKVIETHLLEPNVFVSTLIDYYGIHQKHDFSNWVDGEKLPDKNKRIEFFRNCYEK